MQVASESDSESMRDGVEQSEIPIIVKHTGGGVVKAANNSVDEEPSVDKVEVKYKVPISKDKEIVALGDGDGAYLKLNGNEEECVFSSTVPETKPAISVSQVTVFVCDQIIELLYYIYTERYLLELLLHCIL